MKPSTLLRTTLVLAACVAIGLILLRVQQRPALAASNGAALYLDKCGICHEANGKGTPASFPPLAGNSHVTAADPTVMIVDVLNGMPLSDIYVNGHVYGGGMPAWGNWLSDAQVAAIVTYMRNSWGNHASAVSAQQVARARKAHPQPQP